MSNAARQPEICGRSFWAALGGNRSGKSPLPMGRRRISPLRLPPILPMEISPPTLAMVSRKAFSSAENCRGLSPVFRHLFLKKFEIAGPSLLFEPQVSGGRASGYWLYRMAMGAPIWKRQKINVIRSANPTGDAYGARRRPQATVWRRLLDAAAGYQVSREFYGINGGREPDVKFALSLDIISADFQEKAVPMPEETAIRAPIF